MQGRLAGTFYKLHFITNILYIFSPSTVITYSIAPATSYNILNLIVCSQWKYCYLLVLMFYVHLFTLHKMLLMVRYNYNQNEDFEILTWVLHYMPIILNQEVTHWFTFTYPSLQRYTCINNKSNIWVCITYLQSYYSLQVPM